MTLIALLLLAVVTFAVVYHRERREYERTCSLEWRADYARREGRIR